MLRCYQSPTLTLDTGQLGRGYRVAIVDVLDWMWTDRPAGNQVDVHLVQRYFAERGRQQLSDDAQFVRPIVDRELWTIRESRSRNTDTAIAVIGLGGLNIPGMDDLIDRYIQRVVGTLLSTLLEYGIWTKIHIIGSNSEAGGLLWMSSKDPRIQLHSQLDGLTYSSLFHEAYDLFVVPGLGSIYECSLAHLNPCFLPGFSD